MICIYEMVNGMGCQRSVSEGMKRESKMHAVCRVF